MTSQKFAKLLGGPARIPESELTQRECDIAASIQAVTEEILMRMVRRLYTPKPIRPISASLVESRSTALPMRKFAAKVHSQIFGSSQRQEMPVEPWAPPCFVGINCSTNRVPRKRIQCKGHCLAPSFRPTITQVPSRKSGIHHEKFQSQTELLQHVARQLSRGKTIGWFQGRMEFGPRALGNRSIFADPRRPEMWSKLNQKIKFRESFRPFGPAILRESASTYFEIPETSGITLHAVCR